MENTIQVNIDELDNNILNELKVKFKHKYLEIRILDDTELLSRSDKMLSRINDAKTRQDGLSLEEVIEKYNLF